MKRFAAIVVGLVASWALAFAADPTAAPPDGKSTKPASGAAATPSGSATQEAEGSSPAAAPRQLFSGKVVLLTDALKRRGVKAFPEMKDQVVLETETGELIPIVSDWRGRALFQDDRLQNRKVELIGRRQPGVPYLQVLMIFLFDEKGERQYMDYWCDICAIPMYEIKPCDCCQADIRLRFQPKDLPEEFRELVPAKKPAAPQR